MTSLHSMTSMTSLFRVLLSVLFLFLSLFFAGCGNSSQRFYEEVNTIAENQATVMQEVSVLYKQVSNSEMEKSVYSQTIAQKQSVIDALIDQSKNISAPTSGGDLKNTLVAWLNDSKSVITLLENTALIPSADEQLVPVSLGEELSALQSTMETLSNRSAQLMTQMQAFQQEEGLSQ